MRQLLLFILFVCFSNDSFASHNRGADLSYEHLSGYTYKIRYRKYATDNGLPSALCQIQALTDSGDTIMLTRVNGPSFNCSVGTDGVSVAGCNVPLHYSVYEGIHTYPGPGTYDLQIADGNLLLGICNVPGSDNQFILTATIVINNFLPPNNGVIYSSIPNTCDTIGIVSIYSTSGTDPDSDSLYYEFIYHHFGQSLPPPSFSIDSLTGFVEWDSPNVVCEYSWDIRISEFKLLPGSGTRYLAGKTSQKIHSSVYQPVSVELIGRTPSLYVFPNPSTGSVFIRPGQDFLFSELQVYTMDGRQVKTATLPGGTEFEIAGLPAGMYSYLATDDKGVISSGKFVISGRPVK